MIELVKVNKKFGKVVALDNVSLHIKEKSIFGIIGESGAGKSTAIRVMNLLEKPDSGQVLFNGKDLTKISKNALLKERKKISMIFQGFNLFPSRTVYENVAFPLGKDKDDEKINYYLDLVGLSDKKHAYPNQLSGGQKQRVAIARALVTEPQVLLSDEATSALDPKTTTSILQLLKEINQKLNITIILITHQMEVVKSICDEVAIMESGCIVQAGKVEQVLPDYFFKTSKLSVETTKPVYELHFESGTARKAIISNTIKNFDVSINILQGNIEKIGMGQFGILYVSIEGNQKAQAIAFLSDKLVVKEVIQ